MKLCYNLVRGLSLVVVGVLIVVGLWTTLYKIAPYPHPSPIPAPLVRDTAMAKPPASTWWCNGSMGSYSIDPDVPGRINACIYVLDFKPGQTLVLKTENARRIRP